MGWLVNKLPKEFSGTSTSAVPYLCCPYCSFPEDCSSGFAALTVCFPAAAAVPPAGPQDAVKIRYASEVEARIPAGSAVAACLCGDSPAAQIDANCPEAPCLACSAEEQDDCLVAKAGCPAEPIAADLADASVLPAWFAESPDVSVAVVRYPNCHAAVPAAAQVESAELTADVVRCGLAAHCLAHSSGQPEDYCRARLDAVSVVLALEAHFPVPPDEAQLPASRFHCQAAHSHFRVVHFRFPVLPAAEHFPDAERCFALRGAVADFPAQHSAGQDVLPDFQGPHSAAVPDAVQGSPRDCCPELQADQHFPVRPVLRADQHSPVRFHQACCLSLRAVTAAPELVALLAPFSRVPGWAA